MIRILMMLGFSVSNAMVCIHGHYIIYIMFCSFYSIIAGTLFREHFRAWDISPTREPLNASVQGFLFFYFTICRVVLQIPWVQDKHVGRWKALGKAYG